MKKFRRLAALLLAGVMALMMFAGCSDYGVNSAVENELMKQINALRASVSASELKNDSALHAEALQMLDKIDPESGLLDADKTEMDRYQTGTGTEMFLTQIMIYIREDAYVDRSSIPVEITAETLKSFDLMDFLGFDPEDEDDLERLKEISAFTVAARTIGGRTYLAVGYTVADTFD